MSKYIVHTAIKCSDDKVHRLSYDLTEQTEGSVNEFSRFFYHIEERFPDVQFWIHKYPENDHSIESHNNLSNEDLIYGKECIPSLAIKGAPKESIGYNKEVG